MRLRIPFLFSSEDKLAEFRQLLSHVESPLSFQHHTEWGPAHPLPKPPPIPEVRPSPNLPNPRFLP